jgi:hypothetical protein
LRDTAPLQAARQVNAVDYEAVGTSSQISDIFRFFLPGNREDG